MKIKLTILLILIPTFYGLACTCHPIGRNDIGEIIERADFVIIGTATENVHHNNTVKTSWDKRNEGIEVRLKVDSVLKGKIHSDYVLINQFSTGNCAQVFEFGEKYVIVGYEIREFVNKNPDIERTQDGIPLTLPPPPAPSGLEKKKLYLYDIEKEAIEFWNKLALSSTIIYTSQCESFYASSTYGRYFLEK